MERRQLEYFLAVSEHGGFSSAARALHVAQPSLSHAIGALENEVGGALFHRLPNGVVLTPAGEALVRPAHQVARDLATASASVREVLGLAGGHLDIAAQTSLAVDPLATMVGVFLERHPKVVVRVTGPDASSVGHLVRSGASELGLAGSNVPDDLDGVDLRRQELALVLPPGSPSCGDEPVTHAELAAWAFVVAPPGTASRGLLESAAHGVGAELRIAVETAHRAMLVPLVLAGVGAALLPRSMASDAAAKGAVVRRASPALSVGARLMWRRGPLSPAAASFVDQVRVGSP